MGKSCRGGSFFCFIYKAKETSGQDCTAAERNDIAEAIRRRQRKFDSKK